jgi:hypothetical protein
MEKGPETFEMEIRTGDKGLFVDFKPQLIVLGPRSSDFKTGKDDHVTVVMSGDRIDQAHRKADGVELWHHTGEHLEAELDSPVANATTVVDPREFSQPNTFVVSARRMKLLFSVATLPFSVFFHLFWRLVATVEVSERKDGKRVGRVMFEERKIRHLARSARRPAGLFSRFVIRLPPEVFLQPMRFLARRVLVDPKDVDRLEDDVWFVISKDRIGLASTGDDGRLQFLSIVPLFDALLKVQGSLPMSLDDFWGLGAGTELRVRAGSYPPSSFVDNSGLEPWPP